MKRSMCLALAAVFAASTYQESEAAWKLLAWPRRKVVEIPSESIKRPLKAAVQGALAADFDLMLGKDVEKPEKGIDAAMIRLRTDGRAKPDGSDIRVYDSRGKEVPHEIIHCDPKRETLLVFYVQDPNRSFDIYYGNQGASAPKYDWVCKRGLWLETRPAPPGKPRTLDEIKGMAAKSAYSYGVQFNMWIFNHYNPMGPVDRYLSLYRGWVRIPETGLYQFGTTSDGASFFLVDQKLVVKQLDGRASRNVAHKSQGLTLTRGVYPVEYYGGGMNGPYRVVATWQKPGGTQMNVIRFDDFPKIYTAEVVRPERRSSALACDFTQKIVESIPLGDGQVNAYEFTNKSYAKGRLMGVKYEWDFGDGTKSTEKNPVHVFFEVGDYEMSLAARCRGGYRDTITRTVKIEDYNTVDHERAHAIDALRSGALHMEHHHSKVFLEVSPEQVEKAGRQFLKMVREYPKESYSAAGLLGLTRLAERLADWDEMIAAGERYLKRFPDADANTQAQCRIALAKVYLSNLSQEDKALAHCQQVIAKAAKVSRDSLKLAHITAADIYLSKGELEKAQTALQAAENCLGAKPGWADSQLKTSAYDLRVRTAIAQSNFEDAERALKEWEEQFPKDMLRGRTSLLRGKLALTQENHGQALRHLTKVLAANPHDASAPEAHYLIAECYMALKDYRGAVNHYRDVVSKYPNCPFYRKASSRLMKAKKKL